MAEINIEWTAYRGRDGAMRQARYYARSASDNTDDWPFWFVADEQRGGLNVTATVAEATKSPCAKPGAVFRDPWGAVKLAMRANHCDDMGVWL